MAEKGWKRGQRWQRIIESRKDGRKLMQIILMIVGRMADGKGDRKGMKETAGYVKR